MKKLIAVFLVALWGITVGTAECNAAFNEKEGERGKGPMTDKFLEGQVHAPDFPTGLEWLNTDHPLSLGGFKGKFVLLDFWTFCCINCIHVIPDLKKLEEKYPDSLVVIGVHSAKFANEKGTDQIRQAILRYEIRHPVVNDKDFEVWNQYAVQAWPTLVLINPLGRVIGVHSGEGVFEVMDPLLAKAVNYFDSKGELHRSPLELVLETEKKPNTLLSFPGKVTADSKTRRLIITDSNHDRILITDPDGHIQEVIGSGGEGRKDGSFETAEFHHPQGTFLDGDVLYIADTENHLIRAADLKTREVKTVLGTGFQARNFPRGGKGQDLVLNSPWDLLVESGRLYIAMAGSHQLWSADLKTLEARPHAGSGREARVDGPLLEAALAQPSGITTDGKKLYFADSEVSSIRAADIDPRGRVETLVGKDLFVFGDVDGGEEKARLQHALGVAYSKGLLYVADTYNSKIKVIDPIRKASSTFAGTGQHGDRDGRSLEAEFNEPGGLAFLGDRLYIADTNNHRIRIVYMKTGEVKTLELSGVEKLRRGASDHFSGRTRDLPSAGVLSGKGTLAVSLTLPKGYHFTEGAPSYLGASSSNDGVLRFEPGSSGMNVDTLKETQFEIPFEAKKGKAVITVDTVIYFCNDGSTVCLFDSLRTQIPVKAGGNGESRVSLTVQAEPKAPSLRPVGSKLKLT